MAGRLLYVFAKEPRPGRVKTRLCPPLAPAQAVLCQKAFLEDLVDRMMHARGADLVLCGSPDAAAPELVRLAAQRHVGLRWQGEGDLGARMARALGCAESAAGGAVILGADSPDLPLEYVEAACAWLDTPGVVLGPSLDGGYYLVGSRGPLPPIFEIDAEWGSDRVFEATERRAREAGSRLLVLPLWEDVDDIEGLRRLAGRLAASAATGSHDDLPATRAALAALAAQGVRW